MFKIHPVFTAGGGDGYFGNDEHELQQELQEMLKNQLY